MNLPCDEMDNPSKYKRIALFMKAPPSRVLSVNQGVHLSRNPLIVRILVTLGYMRELGEGIPRMFDVMEREGFYPPQFAVAGSFVFYLTLRNQPVYDRDTLEWLSGFANFELTGDQKRLLAFARTHD